MADWRILERAGVRLAVHDFGGEGPTALLFHGLAGHAGDWTETAAWLTGRCHVLALDARGHGRSERRPADVSRAAHARSGGGLLRGCRGMGRRPRAARGRPLAAL